MMKKFLCFVVSLGFFVPGNILVFQPIFLDQIKNNEIISLFCPRDNLILYLSELIKHEKKSIQIAAYNLTCRNVVDQLLAAHQRRVAIEIITGLDGLQCRNQQFIHLLKAGIPIYVMAENFLLMHNKYVVFSENIDSKPFLWTGSANITERGLTKNYENVILLKDKNIIREYQSDFNELKTRIKLQPQRDIVISSRANRGANIIVSLVQGIIYLAK